MLATTSCNTIRQHHHLTEHLFMQPARINITHYGGQNAGSPRVLNEQVTFSTEAQPDQTELNNTEPSHLDTTHIYQIPSVTVVSRARFAPVREGQVNIDFIINVPKEYLSDKYQICLTPELLHNDSLVFLKDVVLRGKDFIEKQEQDYERYDEYVAAIIDPTGYDTAFINHRAVDRELEKRRKNELTHYYTRWNQHQEYLVWKSRQQEKYDTYNIKQAGKLNKKLNELHRNYQTNVARLLAAGQDTTFVSRKYREKREKMKANASVHRQITLGTVPAKYRDLHLNGIKLQDIEPVMPEKEDSIRIASEYIMYEHIAFNEIKESRREEVFNRMVPEPYRHNAHHNATINPEWNFTYRYTTGYPVTPGLKNLRLTMKGYITATDRSYYNIKRTDTLSYIISSIDELADGRLIAKQDLTTVQRTEYAHALRLFRNREYQRALSILNDYKDYNTALALTCLGYNQQAYTLVVQLEKNANTHYLAALLSCRLEEYNRAIVHLKEAYKLDSRKSFRAERDPEISKLISTYGLQKELDEIVDTSYKLRVTSYGQHKQE